MNERQRTQNEDDSLVSLDSLTDLSDPGVAESVKIEKERVLRKVQDNPKGKGLRIIGLNKIYDKPTSKAKSFYALKNLFMGIDSGELLGLLGPNGAGI